LLVQAQEKERLISKPKMLEILSAMRKECSDDLKILKELFRKSNISRMLTNDSKIF